jgi:peptidoglycan/xylan/chitin deacetylase (PgdA/CDA1 family)
MKNNPKILMYHSVGTQGNSEVGAGLYCVTVERFREQMEYIKRNTILVTSHKSQVTNLNVIVTFDDGLLDNYTNAYPILKELGLKAYFFIVVAKVGKKGYMNWKQIRELRNAGMTIGSHGMTHKVLIGLSNRALSYEIRESKKIMEEKLGDSIDYFSIPYGHYNAGTIEKIKQSGYKAVFTSNPKDNDGFKFGRIAVKGDWNLEYLNKVINNGYTMRDKSVELIKSSAKRILGVKNYDSIRAKILK